MTGKEYIDDKYGTPRGNGYGIPKILDEFAEAKFKDALKRLPRHKVLIKADPAIDGLEDREIETIEVKWLMELLNIKEDVL